MSYNDKANRTFRINGSLEIEDTNALFVQNMEVTIDAGVLQRDHTGTGTSVFTQNGDVIGSFSFNLKNTVDLYEENAAPSDLKTVSKWISDISSFSPSIVEFIQTFYAPNAADLKYARVKFSGRIMSVTPSSNVDNAVDDMVVNGEITTFTSAQRSET